VWVTPVERNPDATLRLLCFPYAGGGAWAFQRWASLGASVEVCAVELPGRGARFAEPARHRLTELVPLIVDGIADYTDRSFAFFGHSMGALLAFEVARHLRRAGRAEPVHLFVSGREAPHVATSERAYHQLPDAELKTVLRDLNGTPEEVLASADLMQLMLPLLRADFEVVETYRYAAEAPLDCPITAFGGRGDDTVRIPGLESWREQTTAGFALRLFDGDHFFLREATGPLLRVLAHELEPHAVRA
jgi:medium-chain acyl-[acyl-carrier-protein] hydrolase